MFTDIRERKRNEAEMVRLSSERRGAVMGLAPGQSDYRILIAEDQLENQLLLTRVGDELRSALKALDAECIMETIRSMGEKDRVLERTLMQLAENYDYPTILNTLREAEE